MDTLFAECCLDDVRSVVVHQIALDHGLAVGVLEHGLSKNLRGLQGRRSGQRNAGRVEVFDDCAVLALVVQLVAVEDFRVAHLLIEDITTVGLIHDDEVKVVSRQGRILRKSYSGSGSIIAVVILIIIRFNDVFTLQEREQALNG